MIQWWVNKKNAPAIYSRSVLVSLCRGGGNDAVTQVVEFFEQVTVDPRARLCENFHEVTQEVAELGVAHAFEDSCETFADGELANRFFKCVNNSALRGRRFQVCV